ncbi:MAG: sugar ABC transporter permease [Oscillospiraceae bacterium]|nr:sugar ABC transporter permease [Oscillospiraceae bacterium]
MKEQGSPGVRLKARRPWTKREFQLFLLALVFALFVVAFCYVPLLGWSIAFIDYNPGKSLFQQKFVGLANFKLLWSSKRDLGMAVRNTLALSGLSLLTMPVPLIFAILLSELPFKRLSKLTQTISALPYFISHVLLYAVCFSLFSPTDGAVNVILRLFYGPDYTSNLLAQPDVAWRMQTFICLYKGMGYSAIMYLSAMSGIDQELYDAASVDGAGRLAKILHVTIPGIMPTFIVLLVLNIAGMLSGAGFDQYYVFQNPMVLNKLEVLDTYIYKIGLRQNNFGFATAAGMLKSLISVMLLMLANRISKLVRGSSLY